MSKEILISKRSDSGGGGGGYNASSSQNYSSAHPAPISNYKGVMLCDRPVTVNRAPGAGGMGGGFDGGYGGKSSDSTPFVCGVKPKEQLGLCPSKESFKPKPERINKPGATKGDFLNKHKKWLTQFKNSRKEAEVMRDRDDMEQEEKKKRFTEYSAKMRAYIRDAKNQEGGIERAFEEKLSQSGAPQPSSRPQSEPRSERKAASPAPSSAPSAKKKGLTNMPAWALTKEKNVERLELMEEDEVDALLDFADGLDFEKYIDDLEVRNKLLHIKDRISELASAKKLTDEQMARAMKDDWKTSFVERWNLAEPDEKALGVQGLMSLEGPPRTASDGGRSALVSRAGSEAASEAAESVYDYDDSASKGDLTYRVADRVLHSSHGLRKIHSSHSIRAIMNKAQKGGLDAVAEEPTDLGPSVDKPVVKNHKAAAQKQTRTPQTTDVSNLPYLYRNPAI